jgi:Xaa-Pro aminopeptidase
VAFDEHSSSPHYFPRKKSSKTIKPETIILIDMWARLKFRGTPYADITWVGYYGQSSTKKIEEQFNCLLKIRDDVLLCIEKRISDLPTGKEIDDFTRNLLSVKGFNKNILHSTGHSISPKNCHGHKPHLNQRNNEKILVNQLYTIEPGIYFSDYGLRTEIDFYINKDYRLIITTPKQTELVLIQP